MARSKTRVTVGGYFNPLPFSSGWGLGGGGGGGKRGRNVQIPVMALTPPLFYGESSSVLTGGYSDDCPAVVSSTLFPAASGLFGQRPLAGQPLQNLLVLDKVPGGPTLQATL